MRRSKAHFVTSCQQLLALGAVLAVLTPAASVISLDVVRTPGATQAGSARAEAPVAQRRHESGDRAAVADVRREPRSTVPTEPVEALVEEVALTPESGSGADETPEEAEELTRTTVLSEPQPVTGYGAVGVTWSHADQVDDDRIRLQVRTATGDRWSDWEDLEYHDDHAPDAGSEEGRGTRPGTDPLFVGEVDRVQLRATATEGLPDDMSLAVVAPGRARDVAREAPGLPAEDGPAGSARTAAATAGEDAIELQATTTSTAPRPTIFTREQWGANERLRDGQPRYGSISAGFVHHTVNANDYARDDVPGMLRSIYAYHTQSRGWSDIGYNFLVDKFGRIWEGRYGGVARPVVGAHTLGYNEDSFAMSAIGNYETARPSDAMLRAYGRLFAWKLGLAGIDPTDMSQNVSGDTFAAINGHRDAGSTACPGRFLYAQIPTIRQYADEATQQPEAPEPVTLQQVDTDLASTPHPDLVVRRASNGRGLILPTGGLTQFLAPTTLAGRGWGGRTALTTPDLTGDRVADLVTFDERGDLEIRPGPATDGFREVSRTARAFRGKDLVAAAGDLTGDGRVDFVARSGDELVTVRRTERRGFRTVPQGVSLRGYQQLVAAGDVTGDSQPDLWGRGGRGGIVLHRGLGGGRFSERIQVAGDWADLDWLVGGVDYTGDGVPDLVARRSSGVLVVIPSRGDGTLGRAVEPVGDGTGLTSLSGAGQVTGNAAPDLVAVSGGSLVTVPNRGTFDLGPAISTGQSFRRADRIVNAGDFDGDGNGDVVLRRRIGSLWLYRGRGDGRLHDPVWIGGKATFAKVNGLRVVADVTGDKRHDLVGRMDSKTWVWAGKGAQPLAQQVEIDVAPESARSALDTSAYDWTVPTSDLRRRGAADLVVRDGDGYLYRIDGSRAGYGTPRLLGEAGGFDLAG